MNEEQLKGLLKAVKDDKLSISDAVESLKKLPFERIEDVLFDHHRYLRKGIPEIIYGPNKEKEQLLELSCTLVKKNLPLLITRVERDSASYLVERVPELKFNPIARTISFPDKKPSGRDISKGVLIITAGTSDLPVCQEAQELLSLCDIYNESLVDVGISGIHRFFERFDFVQKAGVIIVIAGMEGALPGIVAGCVSAPVIAVPTSIGYGSHLNGLVPLFTMLNSCAPGMAVVNIDSGIGAALFAASIIKRAKKIS